MNIATFKEISETATNRFEDSPLGKEIIGKVFDRPASEYDMPLGKLDGNIRRVKNDNDVNESKEVKYENREENSHELSLDERQTLKDTLGWSDKKIDDNCKINDEGIILYKTDCQYLEGQESECGVLYKQRTIEYEGVTIEGVFPVFDSRFDTDISAENYQASSPKQFGECNKNLKEAIEENPNLSEKFTTDQLEDIANGDTPRDYTWHHNEEPGKMQLVKTEDHDRRIGGAAHTGGNSIWGNKSIDRYNDEVKKGEAF